MSDMVKAERQKILSRKTTKILFVAGILLIIAYFFFFQFFYNTVFYNYETGKMDSANGFAAIEQRKEIAALFDGKLTKDTLMEMQQKLTDAKASTEGQDENSAFSATYVYRDQTAILEHMVNADGSMKSLHEAYPNSQSVTLGYCDGWDMMLSGMGGVLSLLMCLIVVIGLSPVFAEEYACHTDSVICAARYGKTKLTTAKIIASLEAVIRIYTVYLILYILLYGGFYGLDGWNVSIQSVLHYASSTYAINFLQMFLTTVMLNILGIVALTVITLFLSAKMGSPVFALIVSCIVCFLPVLFDFSDSLPILQKTQEICPIFMLHINGVFAKMQTYLGIVQPTAMGIFNLGLIAIFYALTKSTFKQHQVTG
ncbi:hypothetical protein [Caproicibacter fermentans]|uniref:Uncharacterized protein n=1 Tax=Caproicibacter fermentans TaxID=2576756 RepID=A0A7G8T9H9_9FIRM|nr:hypothetical protein [Caproicibacter fermentans]QNK40270.1 hypothetical protein HCR03_16570 [Caproicibacter fermentans]